MRDIIRLKEEDWHEGNRSCGRELGHRQEQRSLIFPACGYETFSGNDAGKSRRDGKQYVAFLSGGKTLAQAREYRALAGR